MKKIYIQVLKRSVPLLLLALFTAAIGFKVFTQLPRGLFPEVDYPRVLVNINMGFAPLPVMEWGVTSTIEKELRAVPGVRVVKSSTSRGLSTINIFLRENEDVSLATQRVTAKVAEIRSLIPAAALITIRPITASTFTGAEYCFVSKKMSTQDLRTYVEFTLKPIVLVIPGVFNARVLGGDLPEYRVSVDAKKLALNNLTVTDLNDRIRNSNSIDFLGPVSANGNELLVFGGQLTNTPERLSEIIVNSSLGQALKLKDIAIIEKVNAWKYKDLSLNGKECVALDVFYQSGIDQGITSRAVSVAIASSIKKENGNISYRSWDLNDFTDKATNAVLVDLGLGMLIIGLVTFFFLGNWKYSLFSLISMPIAAALTFLAMQAMGLSINLMTLGGLTAAIGLVVDNTVIILEMYHHKKLHASNSDTHPSNFEILLEVLTSVTKPMLLGTLTIAMVFTPIGLLSGLSGMFFKPMAHVHSAALMISILLAILVIPGLILLFDRGPAKKPSKISIKEEMLSIPYLKVLKQLFKHPSRNAVLLLVLPLLGMIAFPFAKTGFLPEWDEGDMVIDYRATQPLSLKSTVQELKPLEEYLNTIPEIDFFIRKTGTSLGTFDKSPYLGEIVIKLKTNRKKTVFELKEEILEHGEKNLHHFELDVFQILPDRLNDLSGSGKPVVIYLRGDDELKMDEASVFYKDLLEKVSGLDSIRIDEAPKSAEINYTINENLSRAIDLNPTMVDEYARFALFSLDSSSVQVGPQTIPIRLKLSSNPTHIDDIAKLPIYTLRGGLRTLGSLGEVKKVTNRIESNHVDGNPIRSITAELSGRDLGSVVKDIQSLIEKNQKEGVSVQLAGDYENQQKSFQELIMAFFTGLAIIFLVSLFFSNSLKTALSLTACSLVPPTFGLVGLVLTGTALDVSSFSGLISVTGIAVANSFMALSAIDSDPEYESHFENAVLSGMLSRIRPILMTNFAAMAGFIPIALGIAEGDEILRPFSIAVIIGLWGAMFTTLILVPLFYRAFCKARPSHEPHIQNF